MATNEELLAQLLKDRSSNRGWYLAGAALLLLALWFSHVFSIKPHVEPAVQPTSAAVVRPTAVIARSAYQPVSAAVVVPVVPAAPPVDTRPVPQATAETYAAQASSEAQDLQQRVDAQNAENAANAKASSEQNTLDSLVEIRATEQAAAHALAEQTKKDAEAKADAQAAASAAQKKAECEASMASSEMNTLMSLLPPGQKPDVNTDCE